MLVISFPTVNYSSGILSDPSGFMMLIIACYLLSRKYYYLLSPVICLGIMTRDTLIAMILVTIIYICLNKETTYKKIIKILFISIPPILVLYGIRTYFSDIPDTFPADTNILLKDIMKIRGFIITVILTIFPILSLILISMKYKGLQLIKNIDKEQKILLFAIGSVNIVITIMLLYIYMSGRYVWPLYPVLIPLAVIANRNNPLVKKYLMPLSNLIFGKG
jgi:hypothetical protein